MFRRRSWRVDRTNLPLWAALGLALSLGSGCNVILDNDERTLRSPLFEPKPDAAAPEDASEPPSTASDASADASMPDASIPDTSMPDAADRDAEPVPTGCPSSDRSPDCAPGTRAEEQQSCGLCDLGQQTRERTCAADCTWSEWSEWSECFEYDNLCEPGDVDEQATGGCGACNTGTGKRTRTCTPSCGWTDWSAIVCTPDPTRCEPGMMESLEPVACEGMCSSRPVTRTCNAECSWDEPVMGECTSQGACTPGDTRMATVGCNPSFCNKGEQQQMETCSASCTWGSPMLVGRCSIPTDVCRPLDLGATRGWRCRPGDQGYREYCQPSTASEEERCTWDGQREPYQGPC